MRKLLRVFIVATVLLSSQIFAAVGCDLNDPDRDVKRLFPDSTNYKTMYFSLNNRGGKLLQEKIEDRLGDKFTGLYENVDVPYTLYEIYKNNNVIGYIHGVNQKGHYGGLQVFLALNKDGIINGFYYQKLTSKEATVLRGKAFTAQFRGLSLKEFYDFDINTNQGNSLVMAIKNPAPGAEDDFRSTLRAVKKNLILVDEFALNNKFLQYFK